MVNQTNETYQVKEENMSNYLQVIKKILRISKPHVVQILSAQNSDVDTLASLVQGKE